MQDLELSKIQRQNASASKFAPQARRVGVPADHNIVPLRSDELVGTMISSDDVTDVYDSYWRFAYERQAIYLRRLEGIEGPATNDPVLRRYRFTNAYRAADRVSQYLIGEVQYGDGRSQSPVELTFRTLLFKIFNRIETWELIEAHLGPVSWQSTDLDRLSHVLDRAFADGARIYSAAYIMPAPPMGAARKHRNHLILVDRMMRDGLPAKLATSTSLREVYELLATYPGLGPFLAFQYAIDLNYSRLMEHDEAEFVVAGPGALDGISKCFRGPVRRPADEVIHEMVERQDDEFARFGLSFPGLFGRRLQPIDCQNLFCEISKYARVAHPEIVGVAGRTRIKQGYSAAPRRLPRPNFPPKWKITVPPEYVGTQPVMAQGQLF